MPRSYGGFAIVFVGALLVTYVLVFSMTTNITNVSAVEALRVGVYWDSNCANECKNITWGTLTPGSVSDTVVYIRNEDAEPLYLLMYTENWTPSEALDYIILEWNYKGKQINIDDKLQITLTLSVSSSIKGISSFSFDILITGIPRLPGDIDGDGYVGPADVWIYLAPAYGSYIGDSNYDPDCDFDGDGYVGPDDLWTYLIPYYGKDWTA